MKILLTGGKGFLGQALYGYMTDQQIEIYDLPNDIRNRKNMHEAIERNDIVIHAAAIANLNDCIEDLNNMFRVNIEGTWNIITICAELKKPLIFISTCCVYGNTGNQNDNEKSYPETNEPYAASKLSGESLIKGMPYLDYIIIRIGTIYGAGMRKELFPYIAFEKILENGIIDIHGSGHQTRAYIYITDVINGIKKTVEKLPINNIINLCGDEEISVIDVIKYVETITGRKAKTRNVKDRYGQINKENIDIIKAKKILNWYPRISFENGMKKLYHEDKRFEKYINNNPK